MNSLPDLEAFYWREFSGISAIFQLEVQNDSCEAKGHTVRKNDRECLHGDAVEQPEKNPQAKCDEPGEGNILGRFTLPDLKQLGQEGDRGQGGGNQS